MNMHMGRIHFKITLNRPDPHGTSRRLERTHRINRRLAQVDADRDRWTADAALRPWWRA